MPFLPDLLGSINILWPLKPSQISDPRMDSTEQRISPVSGRVLMALVLLAGIVPALIGLTALSGWAFDIATLKSVLPGAVEMKANTGVGLVLSGLVLTILACRPPLPVERLARILALAVAALGLATLGQYLFGWQLGIDEALFRDTANAYNATPGRMSPYSAVTFACLGLGLAALRQPRLGWLGWSGAVIATAIGALSLLGYLWNASEVVTDAWLPPVALNTALAFALLGGGTLLSTARLIGPGAAPRTGFSTIENKIFAGFAVSLLLLLFAGGLTYTASVDFADSARVVSRTQEARAALHMLYGDISDAESAQRAYFITDQRKYLDRYALLVTEIDIHHRKLVSLATDSAALGAIAELKLLTDHRLSLLERGIALHQNQGLAAAAKFVVSGDGAEAMASLEKAVERLEATELMLLAKRETALTQARVRTLIWLLLTIGLATFVF
ncbi:MAG: CHASE3 domain-containing protein, partial [Betaproteobacteria bacterium]